MELFQRDRRPLAYFGAAFPTPLVMEYMQKNEATGPLLDDPKGRWPLLRRPWKEVLDGNR